MEACGDASELQLLNLSRESEGAAMKQPYALGSW